jgi:hypothetical protein
MSVGALLLGVVATAVGYQPLRKAIRADFAKTRKIFKIFVV